MDLLQLQAAAEKPSPAMLKSIEDFKVGRLAGLNGDAQQPDQSESYLQGWVLGDVKRRVNQGLAVAVLMAGTHCKSCDSTNYGYRMGCRCNGDIEWGALMMSKDGSTCTFAHWDDLRAARAGGMPVLNADTGADFCLDKATE